MSQSKYTPMSNFMKLQNALISALGLLSTAMSFAADPVTDAMTSAYTPYRVALFRTNSKAQTESEAAIAQASQAWQEIITKYAKAPTPPYNRDTGFAKSLTDVAAVYEQASVEIRAKKLTEAHETLENARDLMAEIRRRNNVIVYSDHMNAYHAEMEHMLSEGPKWLEQPNGFLLLVEKLGSMAFLAARLKSEAPSAVASDPAFAPALKALEQSLSTLREAILSQDIARVRSAIQKIKGPYSQLFLKFG